MKYDEQYLPYCKGLLNQTLDNYSKENPPPPKPQQCCKALTKECLSCSEGISESEFCANNKGKFGCVEAFVSDCNKWPCAFSYNEDNISTGEDFYDKCISIGGHVFKHGDANKKKLLRSDLSYTNDLQCTKTLPNKTDSLECMFWNDMVEHCVYSAQSSENEK